MPITNMNQNPLAVMLARKRNQTLDTNHLDRPYPEHIPADKVRNSKYESGVPPPQYQHPFTTVPTDGSYPPDLPPRIAPPGNPAVRPPGHWQDPRSFRLKDLSRPYIQSPIPTPRNISHALLQREALTKFHLAVYLADEDAGHDEQRRKQNLDRICEEYMPAMRQLGIWKHQIVFFYHGRVEIDMGCAVWDAIGEWEGVEGERLSKEWQSRKKEEVRAWNVLARHSGTWGKIRRESGFATGSVRREKRVVTSERIVVGEEDWPESVGEQW